MIFSTVKNNIWWNIKLVFFFYKIQMLFSACKISIQAFYSIMVSDFLHDCYTRPGVVVQQWPHPTTCDPRHCCGHYVNYTALLSTVSRSLCVFWGQAPCLHVWQNQHHGDCAVIIEGSKYGNTKPLVYVIYVCTKPDKSNFQKHYKM